MSHADKLDAFVDLATSARDDDHSYWDASDPDNIQSAGEFFDQELGFLSNGDKKELKATWDAVIADGRDIKLLFSAIKILKDKYGHDEKSLDKTNPLQETQQASERSSEDLPGTALDRKPEENS